MRFSLNTAVLFLVFNRPNTTIQVFESIKKARPPRLYIAADGPRSDRLDEKEKVNQVRQIIDENIDWPCSVKRLYRAENLGCGKAVSEAITWFFNQEEEGIILEDDTLPDDSFFEFCEQLLIKYRDNMRIWHIGGASNISQFSSGCVDSYYFSKYNHIWGWATWKSRWKFYDYQLQNFDDFISKKKLSSIYKKKSVRWMWKKNFQLVVQNEIDTWDYQWYFSVWYNDGLGIIPMKNLVTNIGFNDEATHTHDVDNRLSNVNLESIVSNLKHPNVIKINREFDEINTEIVFEMGLLKYLRARLVGILISSKLIKGLIIWIKKYVHKV